jgi:cytochrome P450
MVEGVVILSRTLRDFRVELVDKEPPDPVAHLTVRSRDGICLRIVCRYRWKCLSLTLEMSVANMYK